MDGFYGRGRTGHFVICFLQTSVVDFSDESLGDFMSCHVVVIGIDIALLGPFLDLRTRQKGVLDIIFNKFTEEHLFSFDSVISIELVGLLLAFF